MRWIEINIHTSSEAQEAITEMLSQLGADGVSICDPLEMKEILSQPDSLSYADDGFLESLGEIVEIKAYFAEIEGKIRLGLKAEEYANPEQVDLIYGHFPTGSYALKAVILIIEEELEKMNQFLPVGEGLIGYTFVKDEDWADSWKQYYKPLKISKRVVICPSWETYLKVEDEIVISLDPGSAFGTGSHETTSMCAHLLDQYLKPEMKVLDLGCGSGILSIIASKLGAQAVEAIDIDQLAVKVAQDNITLNQAQVEAYCGELKDAKGRDYNFIVANIVAEILVPLAVSAKDYLIDGGFFLLSGIIDYKKDQVLQAYEAASFSLVDQRKDGDWWAFLYQKNNEL